MKKMWQLIILKVLTMGKGINKYLKSIGKKQNCTYITKWNVLSTIISKIKNRINHKRPCIVGLTGEPRYNEHWVVGIGVKIYGD